MSTGISNMVNNCFLNSIIQMLMASFEISTCFLKIEYRDLIENYNRCSSDKVDKMVSIDIFKFLNYYKSSLQKDYIPGSHQDAHESLSYILDDANDKLPFEIRIKQKAYIRKSDGSIEESEKITTENCISVPLKTSIQASIDTYFNTQEEIKYEKTLEDGTVKISYDPRIEYNPESTPDYLFINLKRFNPYTLQKDSREIEVTNIINFNGAKYIVISYIIHMGQTNGGHYISCKNINGIWMLFNDDKVTLMNNSNNTNVSDSLKLQSIAYIFLYQRLHEDAVFDVKKYTPPHAILQTFVSHKNNSVDDIENIDNLQSKLVDTRFWINDNIKNEAFVKVEECEKKDQAQVQDDDDEMLIIDDEDDFWWDPARLCPIDLENWLNNMRADHGPEFNLNDYYDMRENEYAKIQEKKEIESVENSDFLSFETFEDLRNSKDFQMWTKSFEFEKWIEEIEMKIKYETKVTNQAYFQVIKDEFVQWKLLKDRDRQRIKTIESLNNINKNTNSANTEILFQITNRIELFSTQEDVEII